MPLNVLITAHNEENFIGDTLLHLPNEARIMLVANACTDSTIDVVRSYSPNITIIEEEEKGKVPSLQTGLRTWYKRAVNEPIHLLDADSRPVFGNLWHSSMCKPLSDTEGPLLVGGAALWWGKKRDPYTNIRTSIRAEKWSRRPIKPAVYEMNLLIATRGTAVLDSLIEMDHVYPNEGLEMRDIFEEHGGLYVRANPFSSLVIASDRGEPTREQETTPGFDFAALYRERAPEGSRPYYPTDS